jgi:hypothetical protein
MKKLNMEILLSSPPEALLDNKGCMAHQDGYSLHRTLLSVNASHI